MNRYRIKVLAGGDSPERNVSLNSGKAVLEGLSSIGHDVELVDLNGPSDLFEQVQSDLPDLFFIALHGGWGEDGRAQSILDLSGVPYTGSRPSGCAVSMDKMISKSCFSSAGLEVPWGSLIKRGKLGKGELSCLSDELNKWGKLVVKPCCGGSTVATFIVDEVGLLESSINSVWEIEEGALVEAFIPGRELTVAVLEEAGDAKALPIIEIVPKSGFYDYEAKYDGSSSYTTPDDIAEPLVDLISQSAVMAHEACGCSVYSRADFRLDEEGRPWILEVNSAPGMTSTSLVPKAAMRSGIEFPELLNKIVLESLKK